MKLNDTKIKTQIEAIRATLSPFSGTAYAPCATATIELVETLLAIPCEMRGGLHRPVSLEVRRSTHMVESGQYDRHHGVFPSGIDSHDDAWAFCRANEVLANLLIGIELNDGISNPHQEYWQKPQWATA